MTFGRELPGYEGVSELSIPTGSITGNFPSSNPSGRTTFLEFFESLNLVISKIRVNECNDIARALRFNPSPSLYWQPSPTFTVGYGLATELTGPTTSDPWSTLHERLLEEISELVGDEDEPIVSEPNPQAVDWGRLRSLRDSWARESDDLFEWYAQQEE
jgi:hypothetical protein